MRPYGDTNCSFQASARPRGHYQKTRSTQLYGGSDTRRQWLPGADAIEAQLAHVEANAVRKAYARAEYWAERVEMMAHWADRLDELRRGGIVVSLRA
jgi:hypothetical protein